MITRILISLKFRNERISENLLSYFILYSVFIGAKSQPKSQPKSHHFLLLFFILRSIFELDESTK